MTDTEMVVDGLVKAGGYGLVAVGLDAATSAFLGFSFLGQLPTVLEQVTVLGGVVGAVDNAYWLMTGMGLTEE
ncbi:MAG: hypothetical protein ABEJ56_05800 [Candidatus Nanohaloarchaea archaeon]